jgi:hypothetical protein
VADVDREIGPLVAERRRQRRVVDLAADQQPNPSAGDVHDPGLHVVRLFPGVNRSLLEH